jgi:3-dehydroquinate dehydratase/shikimate dehydrogenase
MICTVDERSTLADFFEKEDRLDIIAYHNFEGMPDDLEVVLAELKKKGPAKFYKIAAMAHSTLDALRMLIFARRHSDVIGIAMGEKGLITRLFAPITYAFVHTPNAPGQVSLETLLNLYHIRKLNRETPLYAVIGDPVSQSPGHIFHNNYLQGDGVYVRLHITKEELGRAIYLMRQLPFRGISVTIPYKVDIIPYLDHTQNKEIGAVNTIDIRDGRWIGYNTDGPAALLALGDVYGKKITILGAGGSAMAIAYSLTKAGALVTLANRTPEKAETLARRYGCKGGGLELAHKPCDLLINTLPIHLPEFQPDFDIRLPQGMKMYELQAELQRKLWL